MSRRLQAVVVDDERPAREGLAADLATLGVDIVASCMDGRDPQRALREQRADVVFVDVEMPEIDGFALLESLEPEDVPPRSCSSPRTTSMRCAPLTCARSTTC